MSEGVLVRTDEAMIDHDPSHGGRAGHPERLEVLLEVLLELLDEPGLSGALERRQPRTPERLSSLRLADPLTGVEALTWVHTQAPTSHAADKTGAFAEVVARELLA